MNDLIHLHASYSAPVNDREAISEYYTRPRLHRMYLVSSAS